MRFTRSLRSELTIRRQKWIEQPPFAARVYADAGHHLLPVHVRVPCGVLEPPDPKTWCEIDDFHVGRHSLAWDDRSAARRHVFRALYFARDSPNEPSEDEGDKTEAA